MQEIPTQWPSRAGGWRNILTDLSRGILPVHAVRTHNSTARVITQLREAVTKSINTKTSLLHKTPEGKKKLGEIVANVVLPDTHCTCTTVPGI